MNGTKKICIEYIWIDAFDNTRSKLKVMDFDIGQQPNLNDFSEWNFDGSSTGQAEGRDSDVLIKPVSMFKNPFINISFLKVITIYLFELLSLLVILISSACGLIYSIKELYSKF